MDASKWRDDSEYVSIVSDLLKQPLVKKMDTIVQHHHSTRLKHSLYVSYVSYRIAKRLHLNYRAIARGGLLHDFFFYDWRVTKFNLGSHAFIHPRVALKNAEKITELSPMERDIILKHMWGFTLARPKYRESVIVSLVDDYAAIHEFLLPFNQKIKQIFEKI
ncbi:hydrolase [Nicoliella spurrieriana]|uniref:Hydrolase n=1 Tax=Nicoliella spurrieriana TaxID=2925830 RepID=A0A976RRW1_9LACO|nr:HD domain-containing protein [Nicoliella spurrieriana]UQS86689.1 hydrolase [Nicoliella spurrieriana]